jgi:hypothetical protein
MKKVIVIAVSAIAAIALAASVSASDSIPSEGKVSFESAAMPALNCTMSIGNVQNIYRLVPGNIEDICRKEYVAVQNKCNAKSHFTHEGVDVRVKENGRTVTIEFRFSGYKIVASDVTWAELDNLFIGQENS